MAGIQKAWLFSVLQVKLTCSLSWWWVDWYSILLKKETVFAFAISPGRSHIGSRLIRLGKQKKEKGMAMQSKATVHATPERWQKYVVTSFSAMTWKGRKETAVVTVCLNIKQIQISKFPWLCWNISFGTVITRASPVTRQTLHFGEMHR